jgi:hypothetical protein
MTVMQLVIASIVYALVLMLLVAVMFMFDTFNWEPGAMPQLIGFVAVTSPFVIYYCIKDKDF